ncbi:MAG TPA: TIGR03435 family protein, partial [Bryobacteraceae bacterium]
SAAPQSEFAVASVRPNAIGNSGGKEGVDEKITVTPASVILSNVTLRSLIRWAYELSDYQLSAPSWIAYQHYDISAKASNEVPPHELRLMMRKLLADRFHLEIRSELKELPTYEMTAQPKKRDKMKPSTGTDPSMKFAEGTLEFHAYSMADLADRLATRPFKLDRPVIDKTGLVGRYDFTLAIADDVRGMKLAFEGMEQNNPGSPSILTSFATS